MSTVSSAMIKAARLVLAGIVSVYSYEMEEEEDQEEEEEEKVVVGNGW